MKNTKKILPGLVVLLAVAGVFFIGGKKALAAAPDFSGATYSKVSDSEIDVTMPDGTVIKFVDNKPGDVTKNWKPTFDSAGPVQFCDGTWFDPAGNNDRNKGITLNGSTYTINVDFNNGSGCKSPANYTANLGTLDNTSNEICSPDRPLCGGNGTTNPGGNTGDNNSNDQGTCELNAHGFSFAWLMCPLLAAATGVSDQFISLFENQLSFTLTQNISKASDKDNVKTTWALVKNIASALVVIIMLVMVISQAIGSGVFDAYTIRKVLPRLVLAVILMQISWPLFSWVVNIFDDIGKGLGGLLAAPFGGVEKLRLGSLLANAHIAGLKDTAGLILINWVALIAAIGLGIAALPAVLAFASAAAISLLVGLIVLVFRKILIILCLIFSPVALLFWILPGTQRYWKFWKDNFIKALMMFPIAIALIYTGRIFAFVVGSGDSGVLLNFIFIMVGYFGPLFLLPKTYRWGGGIMSTAGQYIGSFGERTQKALDQPVRGIGERWQGKKANDYNPNDRRSIRALRRIQSGHLIPPVPLLKGASERSRRLTIAKGDKWAGERNDEAKALAERTYDKGLGGYTFKDSDGQEKTEKGVAGGKLALLDLAGNAYKTDTQKRAARQAVRQLLNTSSWIELQNNKISVDPNKGRRVSEVDAFRDALSTSPEHYSATIRSRPDLAPDVIESAESSRRDTYNEAVGNKDRIRELDIARLRNAVSRLSPEAVPNLHWGFFADIANQHNTELSNLLAQQLDGFANSGTPVGRNAIGSLSGAQMSKYVDAALGHGYVGLDPVTGERKPNRDIDPFPTNLPTLEDIAKNRPATPNAATGQTVGTRGNGSTEETHTGSQQSDQGTGRAGEPQATRTVPQYAPGISTGSGNAVYVRGGQGPQVDLNISDAAAERIARATAEGTERAFRRHGVGQQEGWGQPLHPDNEQQAPPDERDQE